MNHTETVLYTSPKEALVTNESISLRALCHKDNLMQKQQHSLYVS